MRGTPANGRRRAGKYFPKRRNGGALEVAAGLDRAVSITSLAAAVTPSRRRRYAGVYDAELVRVEGPDDGGGVCGITPMHPKVEYPFRVIKRQRGLSKGRFPGLAKNKAHVITLFALWNLWMPRRRLLAITG